MSRIIIALLMISVSYATTFRPVSIKSQVYEADNVYIGEVISINSDFEGSQIISRVFLKLDKWHGANVEQGHVEVFFPGGKVGDYIEKVQGSAKFEIGEKVALMSKTVDSRSWIMNLGLGKFSVKAMGNSYLLVNQIYPKRANIGQIKLEKFESLVSSIKQEKLKERYKNKYEIVNERHYSVKRSQKRRGRQIASLSSEQTKKEKPSALWLVLTLLVLGMAKRIYNRKES